MINAPSQIYYDFTALGLKWIWAELAQEVKALAEADRLASENPENSTPNVEPEDATQVHEGDTHL